MHTLNIRKKDTSGQIELVFNLYRNILKDVMDSNINNKVFGRNNLLQLSKPSAPTLRLERAVLLYLSSSTMVLVQ